MDIDPAMLARASHRWGQGRRGRGDGTLALVQADLLDVPLGPRFGLALLALNSLLLLADAGRQAGALRSLARHLRPDGLAVVDVWLPGPGDLAVYDGRLMLEWVRDDEPRAERVSKTGSATYDAVTGAIQLDAIFDAWPVDGGPVRRISRADRLRLVTATELVRMANDAGLEVEELAGDYDLTPFGVGAERLVLVGRLV